MPDKQNSQSTSLSFDNGENRSFYIGLAAAIIITCLLGLPLLQGLVYVHDDLSRYHLPFRFFYAQSLAAGDSFLWLPNIFCGFYIHGDGSVGMYHPLHLTLYRALPLGAAFNIEFLLNYPVMLVGMYLFLRRWKIPRDGAMLGAIIFTFSGFNLLHYMHLNLLVVVAHIPWMLYAIDVAIRGNCKYHKALAGLCITLLTASQLLLGHPQMFWFSSLVEFVYLLVLAPSWKGIYQILSLGTAKLLGILAGSIQLLPTWNVVSDSSRPELLSPFWPALQPIHLVQLVAPYFFNNSFFEGIPYTLKSYNGAASLILFLWLIVRIKKIGSLRFLAWGAFSLGVLGIVLSLGEQGYLYRLHPHLPFIGMLRAPCRYIVLFHFAMAVIAAIAFADLSQLIRNRKKLAWRSLWPVLLIILASIAPPFFSFWFRIYPHPILTRYFVWDSMSNDLVIAGPILFAVAGALVIMASRGIKYAMLGIVLLSAVDLGAYGLAYIWRFPAVSLESLLDSLDEPPNSTRYRIESDDNLLIMKGTRLSNGYVSIEPRKHLERLKEARLRLANVGWVWPKSNLHLLAGVPRVPISRPLPRVRLVSKTLVSSDPDNDIDRVDFVSTALVDKPIDLPEGQPGIATIIRERPGRIDISTEAASRQLLVLSESYHAGWRAAVDGTPTEVFRIYGDFMGCVIEAGNHRAEFIFRPKSFRIGAWLSALGLGLALIFFLFPIFFYKWRYGAEKGT